MQLVPLSRRKGHSPVIKAVNLDAQLPERRRSDLPVQVKQVIDDSVLAPFTVHLQDVDVIHLRKVHELVESDKLLLWVLLSKCSHDCRPRQADGVEMQDAEFGHDGCLFRVQEGVKRVGFHAKQTVDVLLECVLALAANTAEKRSSSAVNQLSIPTTDDQQMPSF